MSLKNLQIAEVDVAAIQQLQRLRTSAVAGAVADTKLVIPTIRSEDHLVGVVNLTGGGAMEDVLANVTIVDTRASGTLTLAAVVAGSDCVVDGVTYTFSATPTASYASVQVGADDTESAANLAAAINGVEGSPGAPNEFFAESAGAVVTITYRESGVVGNAITTVGSATITASGATLTGGTEEGGITLDVATNQVWLQWVDVL